jgi:FAD/FMN-containing dehydrogenase
MLDLSPMRGIRVDPAGRTGRAEPGITWRDFDRETQAFGLATTGGLFSTTGIAGLTLGGGLGWLNGKYGLACDNLRSEATAFPHRTAQYGLLILAVWTDPAETEKHIRWARESWEALLPFSAGRVYVNYLGEEGEDRVREAYGPNYDRLVALKHKYDPTNFFRLNQNIKPMV